MHGRGGGGTEKGQKESKREGSEGEYLCIYEKYLISLLFYICSKLLFSQTWSC